MLRHKVDRARTEEGFTLIEVILTVALISIAFVAILSRGRRTRLEWCSEQERSEGPGGCPQRRGLYAVV